MTPAAASPLVGNGCVLVLGMHRSGTSATAGLLVKLGLAGPAAGDLVPASEANQRGHFESQSLADFNARVVEARGGAVFAPPPPDPGWPARAEVAALRAEALGHLERAYPVRPAVWKDPRLCLTLPFWRELVPGRLAAVLVLRDPYQVARSLHARDGVPVLLGLAMWDRYVRGAVDGLRGLPTLALDYDQLMADPAGSVDAVAALLDHVGLAVDAGRRQAALAALDPRLRHQHDGPGPYDPFVTEARTLLEVLHPRLGAPGPWAPPELPAPAAWVEDVVGLRREVEQLRHDLYWVRRSRAFRATTTLWRLTGSSPTGAGAARAPQPSEGRRR